MDLWAQSLPYKEATPPHISPQSLILCSSLSPKYSSSVRLFLSQFNSIQFCYCKNSVLLFLPSYLAFSSSSSSSYLQKLLEMALQFQPTSPPKKTGKGNPLPKRNQIKAKIFKDIFRSIAYLASKSVKNARGDGSSSSDGGSAFASPPPSAYASDSGPWPSSEVSLFTELGVCKFGYLNLSASCYRRECKGGNRWKAESFNFSVCSYNFCRYEIGFRRWV